MVYTFRVGIQAVFNSINFYVETTKELLELYNAGERCFNTAILNLSASKTSKYFKSFAGSNFSGLCQRSLRDMADKVCSSFQGYIPKSLLYDFDLCETNLQEIIFVCSSFRRVNLKGANLQGARFTRTSFKNIDLSGANLMNAVFEGVRMTNVNLDYANLQGVTFYSVELENTTFLGSEIIQADLGMTFIRSDNTKQS
jgi:uncharacterized protein YjbI with pentapeptide repeats